MYYDEALIGVKLIPEILQLATLLDVKTSKSYIGRLIQIFSKLIKYANGFESLR